MIRAQRWLPILSLALLWPAGCSKPPQAGGEPPPPEVEVSVPIARMVTDYEELTGRLETENNAEIRARVTGYLKDVFFADGDMVKEGQLLFLIDPRPYEADVAKNKASLVQAEARLARLELDVRRARTLVGTRAMSKEEFDKTSGDRSEAEASVGSARAMLDSSKLYLEWTQVRAPFGGKISRRLLDKGNMVQADTTSLTTIVALDPLVVYFDVDERNLLRLRREAQAAPASAGLEVMRAPAEMGLADEDGYSRRGYVNFEDNRVDSGTGTIRMRAVFPNPKPANGPRLLSPGLYARIRLPIGRSKPALLICDRALSNDQGRKFLYAIKTKNDDQGNVKHVVERRYVQLGGLHDGLREIKAETYDGPLPPDKKIGPGEKIVVSGLQRIRPNAQVTLRDVPMPGPKGRKE